MKNKAPNSGPLIHSRSVRVRRAPNMSNRRTQCSVNPILLSQRLRVCALSCHPFAKQMYHWRSQLKNKEETNGVKAPNSPVWSSSRSVREYSSVGLWATQSRD